MLSHVLRSRYDIFPVDLCALKRRLWHLSRLDPVPGFDETWRDDHSCYGHNPTDVQPFHNLFIGDEPPEDATSSPKKYYTNQELYELLKPSGLALPYVYDHFKWYHCDVSFM